MKKKVIKYVLLIIVYILTLGYIYYIYPRHTEEDYIKKENDFPIVEIKGLNEKIKDLKFENKIRDDYSINNVASIKTNIFNKKVTVTITIKDIVRKYILSEYDNIVSTRSSIDGEKQIHISYLLSEDGTVYKVSDNLEEVKTNEEYSGKIEALKIINVEAIAINQDGKFSLGNKEKNSPCVYIKTKDGRLFTDEKLKEKTSIVEVIEKQNKKK